MREILSSVGLKSTFGMYSWLCLFQLFYNPLNMFKFKNKTKTQFISRVIPRKVIMMVCPFPNDVWLNLTSEFTSVVMWKTFVCHWGILGLRELCLSSVSALPNTGRVTWCQSSTSPSYIILILNTWITPALSQSIAASFESNSLAFSSAQHSNPNSCNSSYHAVHVQ